MKELTSIEELERCLEGTADRPAFIFKHSTACPISAGANNRVCGFIESAPGGIPDFCMVKVIESRTVSDAAAERLGVQHQSPQLILVKGGKGVWSATHHAITADAITQALEENGLTSAS